MSSSWALEIARTSKPAPRERAKKQPSERYLWLAYPALHDLCILLLIVAAGGRSADGRTYRGGRFLRMRVWQSKSKWATANLAVGLKRARHLTPRTHSDVRSGIIPGNTVNTTESD
ncbi:hypothetical protein K523DRAFT_54050 [Schizophyllum commune Tattone D]|nr:hypothetical protein K523DRAFT_54050 [Schizophyllum commune Tattone D]